jgi:hypothetical protein
MTDYRKAFGQNLFSLTLNGLLQSKNLAVCREFEVKSEGVPATAACSGASRQVQRPIARLPLLLQRVFVMCVVRIHA